MNYTDTTHTLHKSPLIITMCTPIRIFVLNIKKHEHYVQFNNYEEVLL